MKFRINSFFLASVLPFLAAPAFAYDSEHLSPADEARCKASAIARLANGPYEGATFEFCHKDTFPDISAEFCEFTFMVRVGNEYCPKNITLPVNRTADSCSAASPLATGPFCD